MKRKIIVASLIASGVLGGAGFSLYQIGMQRGMGMSTAVSSADSTPISNVVAAATVDPSAWGASEGEAATHRHIKDGLKADMIDPLTGRKILYYHDPMVPGKKFETPGKSPFMDMMLLPAYGGSEDADDSNVKVSSRIQQNIGVRTALTSEGVLAPTVSAVGVIAWNERDQVTVQARAIGYVEKLHVRATLDSVTKGQPLLELYVPDWVAAQEDYLSVRRMRGTDMIGLVAAARARMRQAGMDDTQIQLVESTAQVQLRLTIRAPIGGVVTGLIAREGMTVMPGMTLVSINGLGTVWVNAEVPESQTALLHPGARVTARTPALPGASFEGRVQALLPEVNPQTRTRKARMELANPGAQLVPGMFVQMDFIGKQAGKMVLVPSEALIRTGKRTLVMLAEDHGSFRPVEVEIGIEGNGQTEIRNGLQAGQRVVLSGQFLIDSEASLKGIEARLSKDDTKDVSQTIATDTHRTGAHIEAINGDLLTLTHPAIPSLQWPSMTMDFKLAPNIRATDLSPGQDIEITFQMQDGSAPQIETIKPSASDKMTGGAK